MTNENAVKGMSMKKKALIVLCALVSVVVIVATSVLATLALLTSSASVSNVFTIGNVALTMTEAKVKPDGSYLTNVNDRGDTNTYHLVPGGEYIKDPTIHIASDSEPSYMFVTVKNDIAALAVMDDPKKPSIAKQLAANGWALLAEQASGNVYVYVGVTKDSEGNTQTKVAPDGRLAVTATSGDVEFSAAGKDYILFEKFYIDDSHKSFTGYGAAKITINAFAIQDTGLDSVSAAWNALIDTYSYLTFDKINVPTP